jgi:hypothetical protein
MPTLRRTQPACCGIPSKLVAAACSDVSTPKIPIAALSIKALIAVFE